MVFLLYLCSAQVRLQQGGMPKAEPQSVHRRNSCVGAAHARHPFRRLSGVFCSLRKEAKPYQYKQEVP
jgi:hypothetical protein